MNSTLLLWMWVAEAATWSSGSLISHLYPGDVHTEVTADLSGATDATVQIEYGLWSSPDVELEVWVNGAQVGSVLCNAGWYSPGPSFDRWDITALLVPGPQTIEVVAVVPLGGAGGGEAILGSLTVDYCEALGVDTDGDGVDDNCDVCPLDVLDDSDGDGVCDSDDPCPMDSPDDPDGDGVCASDDVCPGGDDYVDSDLDSVADACDRCPGSDDLQDGDEDGVADGCDNCPDDLNPDQFDTDFDTWGDACDACPGGDDALDADGDGVADHCDVCPDGDDGVDLDSNGVPDACDPTDTGDPPGTQDPDAPDDQEPVADLGSAGCGCSGSPGPVGPAWWLALGVAWMRRSPSPRPRTGAGSGTRGPGGSSRCAVRR